ncbi:MAG: cysteine desulfurase [Tannerella sp.]|jgi:cysteine desulfurase/selenocysteine lyase|nr:cysteine desulfurase [Tannerella sp.]
MLNIQAIRAGFPILQTKVYNKQLVYFDNAATTQKPKPVIDKIVAGYSHSNANIHRGVHYLSQLATEAHEVARETARKFLNARNSSEMIFTHGTTEAINLVASSFSKVFLKPGDEVIVSAMEHHSNIVPWQLQGATLKVVPLFENGELNLEAYTRLFSTRTRLVAVTHVSNVLGTINPVGEMIRIAHAHDVPVLIDGAQAVAHFPVDVRALDADFYVFSGHKIYAPTGTGILYGKEKWLERMPPWQGGGEMIASVTFEKTTFNELPYKFEAGTPDFIGSTGLAEALRFVESLGWEDIHQHEEALLKYATERIKTIEGVRIFGQSPAKGGVISFLVDPIHHYDMGMLLDRLGIAVRTGHHCAEPLMSMLHIEGTVRASFAVYNTFDEIDALIAGIEQIKTMF